ncbi:MAG: hypothetical protein WC043_10435 [Pseudobdellovibrionaceae bacterium]
MKQSIMLLALVIAGVLAYTLYGMFTFVPDEATNFTFSEPVLPPEIAKQYAEEKTGSLSASEEKMKTAALASSQKALEIYQSYQDNAPKQAADSIAVLNKYIVEWAFPAYVLSYTLNGAGQRGFEMLQINPGNFSKVENERYTLSCTAKTPPSDVMIGTDSADTLECAIQGAATTQDRMILGGPGNDKITDALGKRIINGGSGDDIIAVGEGRTIILLENGWGKDQVSLDCNGAKVETSQIPEFEIPWSLPYANFIVLSPQIDLTSLEWQGNMLINKATGDSLTVSENCFNLIPPLPAPTVPVATTAPTTPQ